MALQTSNLIMVGLGIQGDSPPNGMQSPLKDGVHLRWAFKRELGFPWHGYYLFRRNHRPGLLLPARVSRMVDQELHGGRYRLYDLEEPACRVQISFNFHEAGQIRVAALLWGARVDQSSIMGRAGDSLTVNFAYDTITSIRFSLGPAVPGALLSVTVSAEARFGWELVPDFPYPMSLPISRTEYPCTAGIDEDLARARSMAAERIRYGDPAKLTALPASCYTRGTVSVTNGSFIVSGEATQWRDNWVGMVLQVDGDLTGYTIVKVVDTEKLILSRGYTGLSRNGVDYIIHGDHFGQLHDYLVQLVAGGPTLGSPMAHRSLPQIIYATGTIELTDGIPVVQGVGTAWTEALVGLDLQVVGAQAGTVRVRNSFTRVTGTGTHWHSDMVGMSLQVAGDSSSYTIAIVESPTEIVLNRPFPGASADEAPYRIFERAVYSIAEVVSPTELTLARAYHGPERLGSVGYAIFSTLQSPGRGETPWMPHQSPLDLVLLGTLHPAMAQMVGLYWVDSLAEEDHPYDYLILADHEGYFHGDPQWAKVLLGSGEVEEFPGVDGYIVFNKRRAAATPLSPPGDLRAYALPAGGRKPEAPNNAGLTWDSGAIGGVLLPDKAVMAHLWRADLGEVEPTDLPAEDRYRPITCDKTGEHPVLVSAPVPGLSPERPADWPPFPLMAIDRELEDGWYSYRVSGIDIFGRHSRQSDAARWHQWDPVPDPKPWYYRDPPGHRAIHSFAVRLLDKLSPPPPAGIEAYALDPADPTVMQDAAYLAWRSSLSPENRDTLVGLRVRWLWTVAHMAQAPDTREFRIYYQAGRMNALLGNILSVSMISLEESEVTVEISNGHTARAYVGALLQTGPNAFKILEASDGAGLCLRVKNIGPHYRVGTISVERNSSKVEGIDTTWRSDLAGMVLQIDGETTPYRIAKVLSSTCLMLEAPYAGMTGVEKNYQIFKVPRQGIPCSLVFPSPHTAGRVSVNHGSRTVNGKETHWGPELVGQRFKLAGEYDAYHVVDVNVSSTLQQLTLDRSYAGRATGEKAYAISHPLFVEYREHTNWEKRIHVVGYDEHVQVRIPPMLDANGYPLMGKRATVTGSTVFLLNVEDADLSPVGTGSEVLYLENDRAPGNKRYRILSVDNTDKTVTVHGTPDIGADPSLWVIGPPVPLHFYEVFLPAPDTAEDGGFAPSLADPIVYAHIGVSAADGRAHTGDDPQWAEEAHGGWEPEERYGNEGGVGPPVSIFRVLRERPDAPIPPPADSDRVYATPTDYQGNSFYTYRWQPVKNLNTHIFRALDDAIFKRDWSIRTTRAALDPTLPRHESYFPEGDTPWDIDRKQDAADELNAIDSQDSYSSLSDDARILLALLPGNEGVAWNRGLQEWDWTIRVTRSSLTAVHTDYFPQEWAAEPDNEVDRLKREHIADELNAMVTLLTGMAATADDKIVTLYGAPNLEQVHTDRDLLWLAAEPEERKKRPYRITAVDQFARTVTLDSEPNLEHPTSAWAIYLDPYRGLSNDALRVLAGLPGNERAFTQITIQPLDPYDAATDDDRKPDDPEDYIPNTDLRIYMDTLPGRSTNRYFYRAAYVDGAQNRSHLSLASPPVYLPKVTPPRTPVITKVLGGDRQIILRWNCSREPDLAEYRIYRADKKEKARDIRLMTLVHTEMVPPADPAERSAMMQWINEVPGFVTFYYLLVAIDGAGNVSKPSKTVAARAFGHSPPDPAEWRRTEWGKLDAWGNVHPLEAVVGNGSLTVLLEWAIGQPTIKCLVQRRPEGSSTWLAVSPWLSAVATHAENGQWVLAFFDPSVLADRTYWYRIISVNKAGKPSVSAEASPGSGS